MKGGAPIWNGLFSAINPQYCRKGIGSHCYAQMAKVLSQRAFKIQKDKLMSEKNLKTIEKGHNCGAESSRCDGELYAALNGNLKAAIGCELFSEIENKVENTSCTIRDACYKIGKEILKGLCLLSRSPSHYALITEMYQNSSQTNNNSGIELQLIKPILPDMPATYENYLQTPIYRDIKPNDPLNLNDSLRINDEVYIQNANSKSSLSQNSIHVIAVTHCQLSAQFHKHNGLREVRSAEFRRQNKSLFDVTTLAMEIAIVDD